MAVPTLLKFPSTQEALKSEVYFPLEIPQLLTTMTRIDLQIFLLIAALQDDDSDENLVLDIPISLIVSLYLIKKESLRDWLELRAEALLNQKASKPTAHGGFKKFNPFTDVDYLKSSDEENPHGFPVLRVGINKRMKVAFKHVRQYGRKLEHYRGLQYGFGIRLLMLSMAHLKDSLSVTFSIPYKELASIITEEGTYARFVDWRRYVLDKAVNDINSNSPGCHVVATPVANGKGRAITDISISITVKDDGEYAQLVENKSTLSLVKNGIRESEALRWLGELGEPELQRRIDAFERDRAEGRIADDIKGGKVVSHLKRLRAMLKGSYTIASENEYDRELAEKVTAEKQHASTHKKAKLEQLREKHADVVRQLRDMEQKYYGELLPIAATEISDEELREVRKRIPPAFVSEFDLYGIVFPLKASQNIGPRIKAIRDLTNHGNTRKIMERLSKSVLQVDGIATYYADQGISKYVSLIKEESDIASEKNSLENQGELL